MTRFVTTAEPSIRIEIPAPDTNLVSCPHCQGLGYFMGMGSLMFGSNPDGSGFYQYTPSPMCDYCGGTGKLKRCPTCGGNGGCRE